MGSAAITASAATTDNHVRQGYINSTGTFWDTFVVCTVTGLSVLTSGVMDRVVVDGKWCFRAPPLTIARFPVHPGPHRRLAGGHLPGPLRLLHHSGLGVPRRKGPGVSDPLHQGGHALPAAVLRHRLRGLRVRL